VPAGKTGRNNQRKGRLGTVSVREVSGLLYVRAKGVKEKAPLA
jgi:hypothetical protein